MRENPINFIFREKIQKYEEFYQVLEKGVLSNIDPKEDSHYNNNKCFY